jgi:hypothetical protein
MVSTVELPISEGAEWILVTLRLNNVKCTVLVHDSIRAVAFKRVLLPGDTLQRLGLKVSQNPRHQIDVPNQRRPHMKQTHGKPEIKFLASLVAS